MQNILTYVLKMHGYLKVKLWGAAVFWSIAHHAASTLEPQNGSMRLHFFQRKAATSVFLLDEVSQLPQTTTTNTTVGRLVECRERKEDPQVSWEAATKSSCLKDTQGLSPHWLKWDSNSNIKFDWEYQYHEHAQIIYNNIIHTRWCYCSICSFLMQINCTQYDRPSWMQRMFTTDRDWELHWRLVNFVPCPKIPRGPWIGIMIFYPLNILLIIFCSTVQHFCFSGSPAQKSPAHQIRSMRSIRY